MIEQLRAKVCSLDEAKQRRQGWQDAGQKLVFTNGCFDLLHKGHIEYLAQARSLGDKLCIGLNSDASVSRLKGKHRPIKDQENRALILAACAFVDMLIIFEEDTPRTLIEALSPDILVKGGDWAVEQIVGSDWVLARGGEVRSLQFIEGFSTTALEKKIREA